MRNISLQLLQQAIQELARQLGARVTTGVKVYGGQVHKVATGLIMPTLPNGIGFDVENGELVVKGDAWNYNAEWERVRGLVEKSVQAMKMLENVRVKHPNAKIKTQVHNERELIAVLEY